MCASKMKKIHNILRPNEIVLVLTLTTTAAAQWLNYPTPGIPRLPDGKPDLSGVWTINAAANPATVLKPGDVQPWAEALTKKRQENLGKDNPSSVHCRPFGPRYTANIL